MTIVLMIHGFSFNSLSLSLSLSLYNIYSTADNVQKKKAIEGIVRAMKTRLGKANKLALFNGGRGALA